MLNKLPSKLGNSDTPEPIPALRKPEPPKDAFPKRVPPKLAIESPEEKEESEEPRVYAGPLGEKRFEPG